MHAPMPFEKGSLLQIPFASLLLLLCMSSPVRAQDTARPSNFGALPADRLSEGWWAQRHQEVIAEGKAHPDASLLLLGDSITNNYDKAKLPDENFAPVWQQFYAPRGALNLGFSGDATEHVLWRLEHGEVDGLHPKVVMLMIGTNNTGHEQQSALQTEVGIDAVIGALEQHLPGAKILLLGILPSAVSPQKSAQDLAVNSYLAATYGEPHRVTYLDISSVFLVDGKLNQAIFYDPRLPSPGGALHPDTLGQRRMAEAIEPTLARLMDDAPRQPLDAMTDVNTAVLPVTSLEQDSYDWFARHHAELAEGPALQPEVVLIGDSITHFWDGPPWAARASGPQAWHAVFGDMPVLNMGFGWDRTQNVLWRLRAGELKGLHPRWVVVNIGTNNMTGTNHARQSTPQETAFGVEAIVHEVQTQLPEAHIIVMAIFPRGEAPQSALRQPIAETNRLLFKRFGKDPAVTWLDIGSRFLQPDGTLPRAMMPDGTHPSEAGYAIWADALRQAGVGQR